MSKSMIDRFRTARSTSPLLSISSETPQKRNGKPKSRFFNITPESRLRGLSWRSARKRSAAPATSTLSAPVSPPQSTKSENTQLQNVFIPAFGNPFVLHSADDILTSEFSAWIPGPDSPSERLRMRTAQQPAALERCSTVSVGAYSASPYLDSPYSTPTQGSDADLFLATASQSPASSASAPYFSPTLDVESPPRMKPAPSIGTTHRDAKDTTPTPSPAAALRRPNARQRVLQVALILQRAARQERDRGTFTAHAQAASFRSKAPLFLFAHIIFLGIVLPPEYDFLRRRFGPWCDAVVLSIILTSAGFWLLMTKAAQWVTTRLCLAFCEMDLDSTLRQGECQDANGTRMREADLLVGSFLLN